MQSGIAAERPADAPRQPAAATEPNTRASAQPAGATDPAIAGAPSAARPGEPVIRADPNSGCPAGAAEPTRQRPGEGVPDRLQAAECDPTRLPTPTTSPLSGSIPVNRWRIIDSLGIPDNRLDPYATNNPLKGDRPIWGGDGFSVLTATSTSLFESRRVPATPNATTGLLDGHGQFFTSQTATVDAVLYRGDTIFRPPDYQIRITPTFNYSSTRTGNTNTTTTSVGAQALFFEKHLRDVSAQYDFDSIRIGIQPVTSDFRGFVFADQPLGIRLFGTRDNDVYQYSVGWFRRLPKNPARQNQLDAGIPANDILMANLYAQDFGRLGLTSEVVLIYDHNRARGTQVVLNGTTTPRFVTGARHDYDVVYLGYSVDGHIGRWNVTGSLYGVVGRESPGVFSATAAGAGGTGTAATGAATGAASSVRALFAAGELSRDFDWIRVRASGLYASGDGNPTDTQSRGFDGIIQSAIFAGSDSAFFIHQRLPLRQGAIDLKQRDSLFPSLRSTADTGESNFTNPGLVLFGLGTDMDLAPSLRVSLDINRLMFDKPESVQILLPGRLISRTIGTDVALDAIYRPFISQNVIARLSLAKLFADPAARTLVGGNAPISAFFNLVLTY